MKYGSFRERLREELARLSSPAEVQESFLKDMGVWPSADELALELDDTISILPEALRRGDISAEEASAAAEVGELLKAMSGPEKAALWDVGHLKIADEWERVRQKAAWALSKLEAG